MRRFRFFHRLTLLGSVFAAALVGASEIGVEASDPADGRAMEITRPTTFSARMVHRGELRVKDTTVRFLSAYTECGAYLSDPSTNYFTDLSIGPNGYLTGGAGDVFVVSGNFNNASAQNALWNTAAAELNFTGAGAHTFALAGADLGPSYSGYTQNFAWGILRLGASQTLSLGDGNAASGAALYVNRLILDGGLAQIAAINGNGASIYYDPANSANAYLLTGAPGGIYTLTGGGTIQPAQTVKILSITQLANGHILIQGKGAPGRSHTIQATTDLQSVPFVQVATLTADSAGNLQYEDANAASFQRRFYRLTLP